MTSKVHPDQTDAVMAASRALVGLTVRSLADILEQITLPQFRTLVLIGRAGAMRPSDVAAELDMRPSGVSRMVDRLEAAGLLSCTRSTTNQRELQLTLTVAGSDLVSRAMTARRELIDNALAQLSDTERESVRLGLSLFASTTQGYADHAHLLGW